MKIYIVFRMRIFAGISIREKIARIFIAAVAVMSLFASSASACTCSHHSEQEAEGPSCHSHVHHQGAAETSSASAKSIESLCECVPAKPAPAVLSRSDKKNVSPHPDAVPSELNIPTFEREAIRSIVPAKIEGADLSFSSQHLTGLLPSRAPPRL